MQNESPLARARRLYFAQPNDKQLTMNLIIRWCRHSDAPAEMVPTTRVPTGFVVKDSLENFLRSLSKDSIDLKKQAAETQFIGDIKILRILS
jgi:hypothetical protein